MMNDAQAETRRAALRVLQTLRAAGHEAFVAGGAVRDEVMGVVPKDYDITTSATPEVVISLFERCVEVGAQFGVIVVLVGNLEVEVATFRTESGYADGRRPDTVTWASAEEDVLRRDFTINGLLGDPQGDPPTMEVIDYVNGVADIEAGVIRAIGHPATRFEEDQLRLLRALRFAARLDFEIEARTWDALRDCAAAITSVSVERIREELQRLLTEGGAKRGWALLSQSGLMAHVLPEVMNPKAVEARLCNRTMTPEQGWTVALLDIAPSLTGIRAWGRRMKTSTALARHVSNAVDIVCALKRYESLSCADRKRLVRRSEFATGLWAAQRAASDGQIPEQPLERAQKDLAAWDHDALFPPPLIDGATLRTLGYAPGPAFKTALDAVESAQLEGGISDRAAAIALATRHLEPSDAEL